MDYRRAGRCAAGILIGLLGANGQAWALRATVGNRPLDLSGHVEVRQVVPANRSTPDDRTREQLWVRGRYELSEAVAFDATLNVQNGGPTTRATKGGVYSYRTVFQSVSPSVEFEEAFVDVAVEAVDLRVGLQKFAWGKLDRFQPSDVLSPERYGDPFMLDEDERKIGVPAAQGSYYLPAGTWVPQEARLTAVWIPQYFPYRFPLAGERWFPPAGVPPPTFPVPQLGQSIPVGFRTGPTDLPSFSLANAGYAGRLSAFSAGVDYALYYYHGFDTHPAFQLNALAFGDPSPEPPFVRNVSAETELVPVFRTIDLWGGDAAYAWGPFTLRFEAAYVSGRPFSRDLRSLIQNPNELAPQIARALAEIAQGNSPTPVELPPAFAVRNAVEWGVGVDYNVSGYLFLLQVNQTDVLHNDVNLLIKNVDTQAVANLRKSFFDDDLGVQLIAVQGIESGYTLLLPRLTYRLWEHLEARVGYVFISGRSESIIGQYKDNDQAFVRLRFLF